jgi:hypothetical protein
MDISKLQELHKQILSLEKEARETDSKREAFRLNMEVRTLQREFQDLVDKIVIELPEEVNVRIKVNKVVKFDTTDFKEWIGDSLLQRSSLEDLDFYKELKDCINEDFDPEYELGYNDIAFEIEDDRFK